MRPKLQEKDDIIMSLYSILSAIMQIYDIDSFDDISDELGEWGVDSFRAEWSYEQGRRLLNSKPSEARTSCELR